jgi:uncharacterized repeat protein (TIGR03803 family)
MKTPFFLYCAISALAFLQAHASPTFRPVCSFPTGAGMPDFLLQGKDGNFYGTSMGDGIAGFGGVYKVTPAGVQTLLAPFTQRSIPVGITQASDGNFYGVDEQSTQTSSGRIFKVTPSGTFTTLYTFAAGPEGGIPGCTLAQGPDGNLYGLTAYGGLSGNGTFFKISTSGSLTVIAPLTSSLANFWDFYAPYQIILGQDKNFYILTDVAFFKMTPTGQATIVAALSPGIVPGALAQGKDGNFYYVDLVVAGMTTYGSLFKVTPSGVASTIASYPDSDVPGSLVLGRDGDFYVTSDGGQGGLGEVLQISPTGVATTYSIPAPIDGQVPTSLLQGSDGTIYGTTQLGGQSNAGVLFNINPDLVSGAVIGTAGSWQNRGNTAAKVFDGSTSTFFDAPSPGNGDWAGLDFGSSQTVTAISFAPRVGYEKRMIGGVFQGSSTADFSGVVTNLAPTLTAAPSDGFTTVTVNGSFRYVRYLSPNGGYGNIAELQFFSAASQ